MIFKCLFCNNEIIDQPHRKRVYCSNKCQGQHVHKKLLLNNPSFKVIKRHLLSMSHECSICHNTEWQGKTIPIELDHIDGNSENNCITNLRLVCPNCHAQTSTYKNKNKGNGRYKRRQRYKQNLSY
jgi:hypothetical protein